MKKIKLALKIIVPCLVAAAIFVASYADGDEPAEIQSKDGAKTLILQDFPWSCEGFCNS
ncbi:MAG: hypothetical protein M3R00_00175 [Pseudomonadota bacterium]|nr:hypothetical protein [Pseudomonadota bacterium]